MMLNIEIANKIVTLFYILGAYIIGSIPSGYLIARIHGIADIRQYGSGNIGATNVARIIGAHYFLVVLLLDAFKAYGYLLLVDNASIKFPFHDALLCGLLIGNSYSCFLNFSGGKGVGTLVGILAAISVPLLLIFVCIWLVVFFLTHIAGCASVSALVFLPCISYWSGDNHAWSMLFVSLWCLWRHKNNIKQLVIACV